MSYKSVERLYSDQEVCLVLYNMHALMLERKGVKRAHCAGDGTGYSLSVKEHYATFIQRVRGKRGTRRRFVFTFTILDLDTRMYVGYGTGFESEEEAFRKAVELVRARNRDREHAPRPPVQHAGMRLGSGTEIRGITLLLDSEEQCDHAGTERRFG